MGAVGNDVEGAHASGATRDTHRAAIESDISPDHDYGAAGGALPGRRGSVPTEEVAPRPWLALVAAAQLLTSTALVGEVPRYRYPVDPFIWIVAGIGVSAILVGAWSVARRFTGARRARVRAPVPVVGDPSAG